METVRKKGKWGKEIERWFPSCRSVFKGGCLHYKIIWTAHQEPLHLNQANFYLSFFTQHHVSTQVWSIMLCRRKICCLSNLRILPQEKMLVLNAYSGEAQRLLPHSSSSPFPRKKLLHIQLQCLNSS